jgi:hypothetical protein
MKAVGDDRPVGHNILLRLAQATHPMHATAQAAVSFLQRGGQTLIAVPQKVYEFWVVATRPVAVNGLGLSIAEAIAEVTKFTALFPLSPDTPAVYSEWLRLVGTHHVSGKNAHDARLVARWRSTGSRTSSPSTPPTSPAPQVSPFWTRQLSRHPERRNRFLRDRGDLAM